MLPQKIAFVDIETTGTSIKRDRIIEIGVIRVENNKVVDKFQTLINPETYVPKEIEALTGISAKDVDHAPTFSHVKKDLLSILDDCVFSAHNVRFDYGFVKQEFARQELIFNAKNLCTVKLSRVLYPRFKRHNLDEIIKRHAITCPRRHRAFDDAWVCWDFYKQAAEFFPKEHFEEAVAKVMKRPSIPINLTTDTLDRLPESPGVYIFYNQEGLPLYVGKSVNIRDRVLSHFAGDALSSTEQKISLQVGSVETIITAGEIGALFKESELVKKLKPLYNRQLRKTQKFIIAKLVKDKYYKVVLEETDGIETDSLENILGIFKSRSQAKNSLLAVCKEQGLCEKLMGLQSGKGACFGYSIGKCRGACLELESPTLYNGRLLIAFANLKLQRWPFDGPIMIEEKTDDDNAEQHIIDNWCYLGTRKSYDDEINKEIKFDLDIYKIINRFLHQRNLKISKASL